MGPSSGERPRFASAGEQRAAYLRGEWGNPLTTTPLGGRLLSAMQLPWFAVRPPRGFGVLTTRGNRTGKRRRRCVRAVRLGDMVYVVSLRGPYAAWVKNVRADPSVEIRIREGSWRGRAREIDDPAEVEVARRAYCDTLNRFDRLEYRVHRRGRPTPDAIRALHEHWFDVGVPVAVELEVRSV